VLADTVGPDAELTVGIIVTTKAPTNAADARALPFLKFISPTLQ
jgi:hypothetical protein